MTILTLPKSVLTYPQLTPSFIPDVISMAKAIAKDGLLNPITVRRSSLTNYRVVDGKKRLSALRVLAHVKQLPRSLTSVPCIDIDAAPALSPNRPLLKTDAEFVAAARMAATAGATLDALTERFDCSQTALKQALSLSNLHSQIMDYFRSGHLSLEQAAAFASIPNQEAQWKLLQDLGPFAHAPDIIASILAGNTVIEIPGGDFMVLPSRGKPRARTPMAA